MGEVYLARDEVLGRDVALKILKKEYASLEEFRKRMGREAESAASLSNPNIVRVYDRGETKDALPYIAMEYMKGGTLAEKIGREGTLAWREAAKITAQVAMALAEAHRRGVVHRDIKPHNVLLTGDPLTTAGSVKVGDFGIARAAAASTLTETSMILGTARYLSPEQAKGEPVGSGSDLYSLGITLYQMLSGKVPFEAESPLAIAMRHVYEVASSPKEINPDVPEELAAITLLLLSKDPLARYGEDALTLVDDLERVCRGLKPLYKMVAISPENSTEPLGVPPVTLRRERHVRRRSKKRRVVGATTAAVLALGLTLGGAYSQGLYELPFSYSTNAADQKEIMPTAPSLGSVEAPSPPEDPQEETMDPVAMEAQPVAYTASVQEELPAAAPAIAQQETEPIVVQEEERPTPGPVVGEEQNSKERPKEEAEEQAKDAEKATKEAEEVAREAQEEAVKEAKELAEQAQENAKESAKKWHNGW
ncbi:MAG: protein kinase [Actinomycetota bacterium]|nr:protein kinase [Actinomycetota bacterium]